MRVRSIPAAEGFTFACSRKAIDACFGKDAIKWISFGAIGRRFKFDSRQNNRPRLTGVVVASLSFNPNLSAYNPTPSAHICLYPVRKDDYDERGKPAFSEIVLPKFREWLEQKRQAPDTSNSRQSKIIAEWTGSEHRFHELTALYAAS